MIDPKSAKTKSFKESVEDFVQETTEEIEDIIDAADTAGVSQGDLDMMVHSVAAHIASNINNSSMAEQIEYCFNGMTKDEMIKEIQLIKDNKGKGEFFNR